MPFYLVSHGSAMSGMTTAGVATSVSLPTGVTVSSARPPRSVVWGREVIVANSTSRPIAVDRSFNPRVLVPRAPTSAPLLSAVAGGTLSGTFKARCTFIVKDAFGKLLAESGFGPESAASATLSSQYLRAANLPISADSIPTNCTFARRVYRTATGPGTEYFPWVDVDGNTVTDVQNDMSDASIGLVAAPTLGDVPDLSLLAEWRQRLWGVNRLDIDTVRYTEADTSYAWSALNFIPIPRIGQDQRGVVALFSRKEGLGIGRQNSLHQITGNNRRDFRRQTISEMIGVEGSEAVVVSDSTAFFLWKDGVYQWDGSGVVSLSDKKVRSWFTKDDTFNRSRFQYAKMSINPLRNSLVLQLAAAGSSNEDRWIEYLFADQTWWGPHKTDATTPTCNTWVYDANGLPIWVMGTSDGFVLKEQDTRTDYASTGVALDIIGKFHDMQTPDIMKYFGQLSLISKIQAAGTLTITPYVGGLGASAGTAISAAMTLDRQRLTRLGVGQYCKLNFTHSTAGQDVEIFGYEIPFHEVGRR
jgi:hypothetical protein